MPDLSKKAFWIASGDISARGIAFITSIYLAKTLGPEYFGLITVGIAMVGYMTWFSDLGMVNIGIRETAKHAEKRVFRVTEIFNLKFGLGIVVWIVAALTIFLIPMNDISRTVLLTYSISVLPFSLLMEWYFNGKQEYGYTAASKVLNAVLYLVLIFLFVESMEDITKVPWFYTLAVASASLLLLYYAVRDKAFRLRSRGLSVYTDLLKSSFILGLGWFFAQIVQLLPPVLIAGFLGLKAAGYYGAAFKFVIIGMMMDRVFVNLLLPNLAGKWSQNKDATREDLEKVFRFIAAAGALITVVFFIESEWITQIVFGDEYAPASDILRWLSFFIAITFINSLFSFTLIATNHDRAYLKATTLSGIISSFIILATVYTDDINLVAASVVFAEILITIFIYYEFNKICKIKLLRPLSLIILVSAAIISASSLIDLPVWEGLIAGIILLILIFVLNVITAEHLKWAKDRL